MLFEPAEECSPCCTLLKATQASLWKSEGWKGLGQSKAPSSLSPCETLLLPAPSDPADFLYVKVYAL